MKKKNLLILDDEYLRYCELNNINDIEILAKQLFNKGFSLLKYGETPFGFNIEPKIIEKEVIVEKEVLIEVIKEVIKEVPVQVEGKTKVITKKIINNDEVNRLTLENKELKEKLDLMTKSIESFGKKGKMMKNSDMSSLYDE
jgi:hypothetical protein